MLMVQNNGRDKEEDEVKISAIEPGHDV